MPATATTRPAVEPTASVSRRRVNTNSTRPPTVPPAIPPKSATTEARSSADATAAGASSSARTAPAPTPPGDCSAPSAALRSIETSCASSRTGAANGWARMPQSTIGT